jgi:hypothetical protein
MKRSNYTVQIIEPNEGFTLTQSAEVDVKARIFSKKIYLAVNDSPDNWKEITDAEAEELQAEQERLFKEEEENNIPNE